MRPPPEVDIETATGTFAELIDAVLAHRIEATFVAGPVNLPELLVPPVLQQELVVVTTPGVGGPDGLRGLAASHQVQTVVVRPGCTHRARLEALLAGRGAVGVRRLKFGTPDGIIDCAGAGVPLLPRAVVARAEAGGRVALRAVPAAETRVGMVLVRGRTGRPLRR